jgi:methylthioribose-1-phosphate isomerase
MARAAIDHIRLSESEKSLIILDRLSFPTETVYIELNTAEEMYEAIKQLKCAERLQSGFCGLCPVLPRAEI